MASGAAVRAFTIKAASSLGTSVETGAAKAVDQAVEMQGATDTKKETCFMTYLLWC
jgi:hypothetical protein